MVLVFDLNKAKFSLQERQLVPSKVAQFGIVIS